MKLTLQIRKNRITSKTSSIVFLAAFFLQLFLGTMYLNAQESTSQFIEGTDTLVVFKNVPGLAASDKYTIRVKSKLTNDQWVNVFAHKCYNRANELPQDQKTANRLNYHYQYFTADWSHTYGNIEMSKNNPVDVEISLINGFQIDKKDAYKAAAHPAHKVSKQPEVIDGKIYFTIDNPGQITIDINGQMDDHHAEINPIAPPPLEDGSQSYPIHTISLFANPILDKPLITNPNIVFVEPGVKPSSDLGANSILYFMPGVHDIGRNFTIFANKTYYIPGDAIVYGTFANLDGSGANIKIFGSGTISGIRIHHPNYDPEYAGNDKSWKLIWSVNCENFKVEGLSLMDAPKHTMNLWTINSSKKETFCTWLKIVTWRSNGDGIGTADVVNDCFLRTADDASYLKGYERKRIIFWRDVHAAAFHMANMSSNLMEVEDCDVIYNRSRDVIGDNGAIFHQRGGGQPGIQKVNLVVRNFRNEDKLANMPVFYMFSGTAGSSYSGILFQNINVESTIIKQILEGSAQAPWYGGIEFDNVTIGGTLLTQENFTSFFDTNEFVKDIIFNSSTNYTLTLNQPENGSIISDPSLINYVENTDVTLTAIPEPGYELFGWTGDASGSTNPVTITMKSNLTVSAVFQRTTAFFFDTPGSGLWTVPEGVNGITLSAWAGGGAGGSAYSGMATENTQARTGGGAGGSFAGVTLKVTPGQVINYTIGAGGTGALEGFAHQSAGESGGTTFASLNDVTIVSALGGPGGENVSVTNEIYSGVGGIAPTTNNIGDVVYYGGNGGSAGAGTGGGGGSAGAEGNGGNGGVITAGTPGAGGGAVGGTGTNLNSILPTAGDAPGAGGAGAVVRNNTPFADNNIHRTGAKGADGMLIITLIPDTVKLTTEAVNGSITLSPPGGVYDYGTIVILTSIPDSGYRFIAWSGDLSGNENPTSITMISNKTVTALMEQIPSYSLTLNATNGEITVDPSGGNYFEGTVVTLTASPDAGYEFLEWTGNLTGSENPITITMDADKNNTAVFNEVTSVNIISNNTSLTTTLEQIYPNPFSMNTTIPYNLGEATTVKLSIYNSLGQIVSVLVNEHQEAGNYRVDWYPRDKKGNRLTEGIYVCQLETNNYPVQTKKIVLIKQ